ncbi:MAG TPA: class I SAM-dependent methyltransferase [Vicinamibacterales bacterium]|nr:class I SAM-dependent methyltransferase [Vicinamibacterales bacterium]
MTLPRDQRALGVQTIDDFGEQWTQFQHNEGFYGSNALFEDIVGPLLTPEDLRGCRVAEIGSGTGRIVQMLMRAGARHVVAIEPSRAFDVLQKNVERYGDAVECLCTTGENIPADREFDLVLSIGVLHHIPDPGPVVRAVHRALRPGGRILVWLYGREGNQLYLALAQPLRTATRWLRPASVVYLSKIINGLLKPYIWLCRRVALPLHGYFVSVFDKMSDDARILIIYDQLRPAYAKYYTRADAISLLESSGFEPIQIHHRHGYSWTVMGTKPAPRE